MLTILRVGRKISIYLWYQRPSRSYLNVRLLPRRQQSLQSVKIVKESFICLAEQNSDSLSSKITSSYWLVKLFIWIFFAFFKSFLSQLQNDISDIWVRNHKKNTVLPRCQLLLILFWIFDLFAIVSMSCPSNRIKFKKKTFALCKWMSKWLWKWLQVFIGK